MKNSILRTIYIILSIIFAAICILCVIGLIDKFKQKKNNNNSSTSSKVSLIFALICSLIMTIFFIYCAFISEPPKLSEGLKIFDGLNGF
jgi:hypothetical protein